MFARPAYNILTVITLGLHVIGCLFAAAHVGGADSPAGTVASLEYVPLSTRKVEQIIGDRDKQRNAATRNRTGSRYRLAGTDLGMSFEHRGKCWFLFGDCIGPGGGDTVAWTAAVDPEKEGLPLTFPTRPDGTYRRLRPPGAATGGFEVPAGGVSIDGAAYLLFKTDYDPREKTWVARLYTFRPETVTCRLVRDWEVRRGPLGKCALAVEDGRRLGIHDGPVVTAWGCGRVYRESDIYHGWVPAEDFEREPIRYFTGTTGNHAPSWSMDRRAAAPVVRHPVVGDVSVARVEKLGIYIMLYGSRKRTVDGVNKGIRGTVLRWSRMPWGPWSEPIHIFHPRREKGYGDFIHDAGKDDGLAGPVIGNRGRDPKDIYGGTYAPYIVGRFLDARGDTLRVWFVLSTWNPYTVVLMRTRLKIVCE